MPEPTLQLPRIERDFFDDYDSLYRRISLQHKMQTAWQWMWLNNVKEKRHELLRRR